MNIALINGSYPPIKCGVGDYTGCLADELTTLGHEVSVITSDRAFSCVSNHMTVYADVDHWHFSRLPPIIRRLNEIKPQVVNIEYPTQQYGRSLMPNMLPLALRSSLGLPTVATIHEFDSYTVLGKLRLALTASMSNAVITTTANIDRILRRWTVGWVGKYHVIPIGSNIPPLRPSDYNRIEHRAHMDAGLSSIVLAYFGFVSPSKGLDTLLKAFSIAVSHAPDLDLQLWILADDKPVVERYRFYHESFTRQLRSLPQQHRIKWTGYLDTMQLSTYLFAADIAILPFDDGASLRRGTLLAALCHRLPIITTRGPSSGSDVIDEGQGVLLVPPKDANALSDAIVKLALNPAARKILGARAGSFSDTFSWPHIASRTVSIYQGLIHARLH